MTSRKGGYINGLGSVQVIDQAVANGDTTKAIIFKQYVTQSDPTVLLEANYAANAFVTAKTKQGCTINFTDPTADKNIRVIVIG